MLETSGPALAIHIAFDLVPGAFGLVPGIPFVDQTDAIAMAASTLRCYTDDSPLTLPQVPDGWAPD
ncbi:MAG: hypothetical protein EXQ74_05430 [Thermoleophilia bacterium]|nr:hypothetical protein [Thermoleophilia bacterium]